MVQFLTPPRHAKIQIGDYVNKAGIYTKPGVVVEKKEDGTVVIDTEKENIDKYHKYSITTGLTPEEKDKFNSIMDDIMSSENNVDRINQLQAKIDELRTDPINRKVVETLRNEQAQFIRYARELPRVYTFDGNRMR